MLKLVMRSQVILTILAVTFIEFSNEFQASSRSSNVVNAFMSLMFVLHTFPLGVTNSS